MSVLEAVLNFKAQEQAAQKAQSDSILQATQLFTQARQQGIENKLKELTLSQTKSQDAIKNKIDLAIKGLTMSESGDITRDQNLSGIDGTLPLEQQINAKSLAVKLYGKRNADKGLPLILEQMKSGVSLDKIEDSIRLSTQSDKFTGAYRNAAQSVLIKTNPAEAQNAMDYMDDVISSGNIEGAKELLKNTAIKSSGVEETRAITGKERTIKLLDEIQGDLNTIEAAGINTNIFSGTAEEIAKKIGQVREPELRKVATKIAAGVQNYRRAMSGVSFSMPENAEYKEIFPSIGKVANFNTKTIEGLREVLSGDLDNFYSISMGADNYKELFGNKKDKPGESLPEGITEEEIAHTLKLHPKATREQIIKKYRK